MLQNKMHVNETLLKISAIAQKCTIFSELQNYWPYKVYEVNLNEVNV